MAKRDWRRETGEADALVSRVSRLRRSRARALLSLNLLAVYGDHNESYFSISLKVIISLSHRYKVFASESLLKCSLKYNQYHYHNN